MRVRWRWQCMFWGIFCLCGTTLLIVFSLLREVDVAARVELFQQNVRRTLGNTNILDGINLLSGREIHNRHRDHVNASVYDKWLAKSMREKQLWGPKSNKNGTHQAPWQLFHADITKDQMYSRNAPYMVALLDSLAETEIKNVTLFPAGSQLKFNVELADGNHVVMKPMRSPRDFVYGYNEQQPFWLDLERHNAEIAAFHLDRILDFRRAPPCSGRIINIARDLKDKITDKDLLKTFFKNGRNTCFLGRCAPWFCSEDHPVCGNGDLLEVSMCAMLPSYEGHNFAVVDKAYPWSQGIKEAQIWKDVNICEDLLQNPANAEGRFLLDLVEQSIFDFLTLNYDRHDFSMMADYGTSGFVVLLDNGKGFGNPFIDDLTLLGPLAQCCIIRRSTHAYLRKLHLHKKERLSDHVRRTLTLDPIHPVLPDQYLQALDRRLGKVIEMVDDCVMLYDEQRVLVDHLKLPLGDGAIKMVS